LSKHQKLTAVQEENKQLREKIQALLTLRKERLEKVSKIDFVYWNYFIWMKIINICFEYKYRNKSWTY
jgi:flagellar biosynthesis regulator FlaF